MLTIIVVLKTVTFIAGFALLGQGVLYILAGAGRETNVFYRALRATTMPATKLVRIITPRKVMPDEYIGVAAFFLMGGIYLALVLEQRNQCLADLSHFSCERLVFDLEQRCVGGEDEACAKLERGAGMPDPQRKTAPARRP